MISVLLNVGGLLDPLEEELHKEYIGNSVLYYSEENLLSCVKSEPFFSDKWLMVISFKEFKQKDTVRKLLGSVHMDVLVNADNTDEFLKCIELINKEVNEIKLAASKKQRYNEFLSKPHTEMELKNYLEKHLKLTVYNSYKMGREYIACFIRKKLLNLNSLSEAKDARFVDGREVYLGYLLDHLNGNESKLKTILDLYGMDVLTGEFCSRVKEIFPKRSFVNGYNFPIYVFAKQSFKRKEIYNVLYDYKNYPATLFKTLMEFFDLYQKIYIEYVTGKLSVSTKLSWLSSKGPTFKITTEYKLELWWSILNEISLERMLSFREGLLSAKAKNNDAVLYMKIVELVGLYMP